MPVEDVVAATLDLKPRRPLYDLYRDYYDGEHRPVFATERMRSHFGRMFADLRDNHCPGVIQAPLERLEVAGFEPRDGGKTEMNAASDFWDLHQLDRRQNQTYRESMRCGDAYILMWPGRTGEDRIVTHQAGAFSLYRDEETQQLEWAAKLWRDRRTGYGRATVYYPTYAERWVTLKKLDGDGWPEKPDQWARYDLDGPDTMAHPYQRVPVVHFASDPDEDGGYGRSRLKPVIPIQDILNKTLADYLVAGEFVALPQRYATGVELDVDEDEGDVRRKWEPYADSIWTTPNEAASFGQLAGANLDQWILVMDSWRLEIGRLTGTPLHWLQISGDWPSGQALRTAEARLIAYVTDQQGQYGGSWYDLLALSQRWDIDGGRQVDVLWEPPETSVEKEEAETVILKRDVGISQKQALRELGYDEDQIERMLEEKEQAFNAGMGMPFPQAPPGAAPPAPQPGQPPAPVPGNGQPPAR